jgi:hypothetical protein
MYIARRDALDEIFQPIDLAEMRSYDKRSFSYFDIDRILLSESCLFGHALGYPNG